MSEQLIQTPCAFGENGNFLLERELGAGGMGGVYMGRDKMLDRPVAVKVMTKELGADPDFVEKFKKEAQSAARLIHPNIAQVYSYGICDGMPYIAMELASGGSLYSIMNANPGKTDVARVIKICQQVAQALQCATDQGCVHGDVKPENILLDANGNAKLVDFGLAGMQKDTNEIWGTPYYISPEKVKKEPIDFRADMYSLGGTLYHALTGVAPFEGDDSIAVVKKRFDGPPAKPSEVRADFTPAIDALVLKMLELKKEDRYPSFEALLDAFKQVLTSGLTAKIPDSATETKSANPKAVGTGARRVAMARGRRMMMKRHGATAIHRKLDGEEGNEGKADENAKAKSDEDEDDEEGGGNLGLKVAGVIVGVILIVGGVIGGLVWYKVADARSRAAEEQAQITGGIEKARGAIHGTVTAANNFADEFDAFAAKAITECQKPTDELSKILQPEHAALLKPGPSKELLDAIAATNETSVATAAPANTNAASATATNAAPAVAVAQTASNAAPVAAAQPAAPAKDAKSKTEAKKGDDKKEESKQPDAKKGEAKKEDTKEGKHAEQLPQAVIAMNELWERAYGCQASAVRLRHAVRQIVKRAAEADAITEKTRANMEKLAELSRILVDLFEQVKISKDVENVRKGITFIRTKGESIVKQTIKRLRIEKLEAERKAKAEAAAAAEKERLEKLEAEKKAKIEEESAAIQSKFEMITAQGCFRQLDWKNARRQLENAKSEFTTAEGQIAADIEIRKVDDMKKVHDIFIKALPGHVFKGKLRGCKVTAVNEREISLVRADGKTRFKIPWQKFYKEYPGNLNEILNQYIVNARQPTSRHKLSLKDWTDAMTGAALTLQLVCAEVNGAIERAEFCAKQSVKEFPEYLKIAQKIFPDIKFETEE